MQSCVVTLATSTISAEAPRCASRAGAIHGGVSEDADALADELFESGHLGYRVLVPSVLLGGVLLAMLLTSHPRSLGEAVADVASEAFGYGSHL